MIKTNQDGEKASFCCKDSAGGVYLWYNRKRILLIKEKKMVLPNFKENLEKYAKVLVANVINVQPGHTVALNIDV